MVDNGRYNRPSVRVYQLLTTFNPTYTPYPLREAGQFWWGENAAREEEDAPTPSTGCVHAFLHGPGGACDHKERAQIYMFSIQKCVRAKKEVPHSVCTPKLVGPRSWDMLVGLSVISLGSRPLHVNRRDGPPCSPTSFMCLAFSIYFISPSKSC